jgi:glucokinase
VLTVGIDIGGTKIAGGVVDERGAVLGYTRVATPSGVGDIDAAIERMVADLRAEHEVAAVGIAAAGFIDSDRSRIYFGVNIPWRNDEMRHRLEQRLALPVVIENDANAAGWAEYHFGAGRGFAHFVMLTIGTGVGGAVVVDGRLYRGGSGVAGELGHTRHIRDGLPCGCGQRGCIEQYASGRALQRIANEIADARGIGIGLAAARTERGRLSGQTISELVRQDDPGAREAVRIVGSALGETCAQLTATLDPEVFVIGGGVAQLGEHLRAPIEESYRAHLPARGFRPAATIAIAELENDAGLIGAADLARQART